MARKRKLLRSSALDRGKTLQHFKSTCQAVEGKLCVWHLAVLQANRGCHWGIKRAAWQCSQRFGQEVLQRLACQSLPYSRKNAHFCCHTSGSHHWKIMLWWQHLELRRLQVPATQSLENPRLKVGREYIKSLGKEAERTETQPLAQRWMGSWFFLCEAFAPLFQLTAASCSCWPSPKPSSHWSVFLKQWHRVRCHCLSQKVAYCNFGCKTKKRQANAERHGLCNHKRPKVLLR